eukprot:1005882-Rhodomonas_salina.3
MMILERTDMWNFRENPWAGFARSVLVDGDSEEAAVAEEEEAWRAWLAHFQVLIRGCGGADEMASQY